MLAYNCASGDNVKSQGNLYCSEWKFHKVLLLEVEKLLCGSGGLEPRCLNANSNQNSA